MNSRFFWYLGVMAGVTYLIRMLPLAVFRKRIDNRTVRSFLYYVPFAVLGAMTFPDIFSSTGNLWSALAGTVVGCLLAFFEKGLLTVALSACGAALVAEIVLRLL